MTRTPPRSTHPDPPFPYTTLFRSSLRHSARQIKRGRRKRPAGHVVPRFATRHNPRGSGGKLERRGDGGGRPYAKRPDRHPVVLLRLGRLHALCRSEEHTSELQSLMRISYAVFCLKKKNINTK